MRIIETLVDYAIGNVGVSGSWRFHANFRGLFRVREASS